MMARSLPEGLFVTYGPAMQIGQFVLRGYEAARRLGVRLNLRDDMEALLYLNVAQRSSWYHLPAMFDATLNDLHPGNAAWIEACNEMGDTIGAIALRFYEWYDTDLATEMRAGRLFYDHPEKHALPLERWEVWAPSASEVRGRVLYPGTLWLRRDYRGRGLAPLMCHLALAAGWTRWNPDYVAAFMAVVAEAKGAERQYGLLHIEHGAAFHNTALGSHELIFAWNSRAELADALESFETHPILTARTTERSVATVAPSA